MRKTPISIDRFAPLKERRAFGQRLRDVVGRVDQSAWKASPRRPDPVALVVEANKGRQRDLLPIKWARMNASPFGFFRGAASLMAADLATMTTTGLVVQLCGDAHVQNWGAYAAPDGHLVFDLNDFDETIPGPWEWDVKRLATSMILAGRQAGDGKRDCVVAIRAFVESYREAMDRFSRMKVLDLAKWEVRRHTTSGPVGAVLQKAERATPDVTLKKLTVPAGKNTRRFRNRPPLLCPVAKRMREAVVSALVAYRQTLGADRRQVLDAYRPVDVVFKVVGTGSVGTRDYVVLLFGNRPDDPLFLQVKEELPSCYARYLRGVPIFPHQGQRVAEGQRRLQTVSDPFVGWTTLRGNDYLVRQLADHKAVVDPAELKGAALIEYGLVCGEVLAKAHARTGDAAAIAGYCGGSAKLDKAIAQFAVAYAEQTELDHAALGAAIKSGKLEAPAGPWI